MQALASRAPRSFLALAAGLALAACGGGSDGPDAGSAPLTLESAVRSGDPALFTQFVVEALDRGIDMGEPLGLDAILQDMPPASETSEPRAI